jgi:hypothetical protein
MSRTWGLKFVTRSIFLALIVALCVSLIAPAAKTSAETYDKLQAPDRAYSYAYYEAMRECIDHEAINTNPGINDGIAADPGNDGETTSPSGGNWFQSEMKAYVAGESKSCSTIAQTAIKDYWGYTSYYVFLLDLGYKYESNTGTGQWVNRASDSDKLSKFTEALKRKGVATTVTAADHYLLYLETFKEKCNFDSKLLSQTSTSERERAETGKVATYGSGNGYGILSIVGDNGVITQHYYTYRAVDAAAGGFQLETYVIYGQDRYERASGDFPAVGELAKCPDMPKKINDGAAAYSEALRLDVCTDIGFGVNNPNSSACVASLLHKDEPNYCVTHYPNVNSGDYKACVAGTNAESIDADPIGGAGGLTPEEGASSCSIEYVGWIACPVINFLAEIADGAFVVLADNFLRTDPQVFNTSGSTFNAWSTMRTIANVAFVIVFLIIIFSQLTGAGITNYGVKKMLPRLVIAAILVNISYFISQLAIDVSNILGYSLKDVLDGITDTVSPKSIEEAIAPGSNPIATGDGFAGIAGGILAIAAVGVGFYALLSTFIPILLAAVVALVMILFILVARQAIIILLVVVSPLAFVAFLLPNTQNLFTQWRKIFTSMLLLFPIIALVFGLSTLASQILTDTFSNAIDDDTQNWFGQIIASAVLILPLFVVPMLLKKSLDSIPMLGQLASKLSTKANGNIGKKLKESYQGSLAGRGAAYRKAGRESFRQKKFAERVSKGGASRFFASGIGIGEANKAGNEMLVKSALEAQQKAVAEEVSAAQAQIDDLNLTGTQKLELAVKGSLEGTTADGKKFSLSGDSSRKAAIKDLMANGSVEEIHSIVAQSRKGGSLAHLAQSVSTAAGAAGVGSKDPALGGKQLGAISQGEFDYEKAVKQAAADGKYNSEAFASMDNQARQRAIEVAQKAAAAGDTSILETLQQSAAGVIKSPVLSSKAAGNGDATAQINTLLSSSPGGAPLPGRNPNP